MKSLRSRARGFSLLEMAIVLVIVGLLLGQAAHEVGDLALAVAQRGQRAEARQRAVGQPGVDAGHVVHHVAVGDAAAASAVVAGHAAQRGLRLFIGRGNCALCHTGPAFSNGEFHDTGVPFFLRPGVVDPGRHLGLREVQASPLNLLGRFNDDASRDNAIGTRHARLEHRHWGAWRTPSLRNVSATAPYMHDGSVESLRDVLLHYSDLPEERLHADGERILRPLRLSPAELDDLLAFLRSLDGDAPLPDFNARDPLQARCP